jgi:ribosomal protein L14E/L6E/L27E
MSTEEPGEYVIECGVIVQIVGGRHKGKFGVYDDDTDHGRVVVYTGFPVLSDDYVEVAKLYLAEPTPEQRTAYQAIYNAAFAEYQREDAERRMAQETEATQPLSESRRREVKVIASDPTTASITPRKRATWRKDKA